MTKGPPYQANIVQRLYKENFDPLYLYIHRIDFKSDWRLLFSKTNASIEISFISRVQITVELTYTKQK